MQRIEFEPAADYNSALSKAADECGIDGEYWDIFGKRREVSGEVRRKILEALGWDTASFEAIEQRRRARFEEAFAQPLAKAAVIGESEKSVLLTLPADAKSASICFEIVLEDGQQLSGSIDTAQLRVARQIVVHGRESLAFELGLPAEVPLGYHTLKVNVNGRAAGESNLIVCPDRAYLPDALTHNGRTAGFNVALYGLRSERNWGCGDFTDLRVLCDWASKEIGFSMIGVNPLHALANRAPYNTSPYLPLSMFYKNLIYIDIEAVPECKTSSCAQQLLKSPRFQETLRSVREAEFVEYERVDRLKRRFLKLLFREFRRSRADKPARAKAFFHYCAREGELLERFALYSALDEILHKQSPNCWVWGDWAFEYQDPQSVACVQFAKEHSRLVEFYKYIQFIIEEQLAAAQSYAKECGMPIGLYHDLALATDKCGSDLWAHRGFYVNGCRVGAPPDDFSPDGQDWAFPPPNPLAHRDSGYRIYREGIRKAMTHGGALRIDHVMRLFRLFWVPENFQPAQGTYVRDHATDLLRILALESVRSQAVIIGEDLGTVTDEIRDALSRFGILSYRLFYFEKNPQDGSFIPSRQYPHQALVSSSTHDLPAMTGFWTNRDIEARKAAGLIDENAYRAQLDDRRRERQRMLDRLDAENLLPNGFPRNTEGVPEMSGDLHNAIVGFLAQTPSMVLLLNQEDFTMETDQQNLPGSTAQYPNWRRKMKWKLEDLRAPFARGSAQMFRDQLARTGRNARRSDA